MYIVNTNNKRGVEPPGHFGGLTTTDVIGKDNAKHFSIQVSRAPIGSGSEMHDHEKAEQVFFVFQGDLTIETESGEHVVLEPGMAAYFEPGEAHATKNNGDEVVLSLVISSPPLV